MTEAERENFFDSLIHEDRECSLQWFMIQMFGTRYLLSSPSIREHYDLSQKTN